MPCRMLGGKGRVVRDIAGIVVDAEHIGDRALRLYEEGVGDTPRLLRESLRQIDPD
jgi:hypothetical protein